VWGASLEKFLAALPPACLLLTTNSGYEEVREGRDALPESQAMSRRQATTITLTVQLPLPPGFAVKKAIELVKTALVSELAFRSFAQSLVVKLSKRETVYL